MHLDKLAIVVPTTLQRPMSVLVEVADRLGQASKMGAEICVFVNTLQSRDFWKLSVFEGLDSVAIKLSSSRLPIDQSMMQAVFMSSRKYILQCGDDDIPILDLLLRCQDYMEEKDLDLVVSCISSKAGTEDCSSRQLGGGWSFSSITSRRLFIDFHDRLPYGSFVAKSELLRVADGWRKFFGTSHAYCGVMWATLIARKSPNIRLGTTSDCLCKIIDSPKSWQSYAAKIYLIHIPRWYAQMGVLMPSTALFSLVKALSSLTSYGTLIAYRLIGRIILVVKPRS
jgi:hypothetical protein